ncbi:MAG: hypothetical protein ACRBDL_02150 [Alphaproteobacteria bacterium]
MALSFILWVTISCILLGFWVWTLFTIFKQKKAWKFYADKKKLRYHSNGLFETPSLSGAIDEYKVSLFVSEHSELDARSHRRLTAIEVSLHSGLPISSAVASGGMVHIVEALDINQEYRPAHKEWDDSYIIRASDNQVMQSYLNDDRLEQVLKLMKTEKVWIVLLFLDGKGLLRLDTPLPIDNPKSLDKLIKQMISVAQALELGKGEEKGLLRKRKEDDSAPVLALDEDILDDDIGLELEE